MLREPWRPAEPDRVHLTLTLADDEALRRARVPEGSLFAAGQDAEGHELLYAADRDLDVGRARLVKVRTLGAAVREAAGGEIVLPPGPRRVLVTEQALLDADGKPVEKPEDVEASWSTFGPRQEGAAEATPATLGFAVASPYLLLSGGERTVTLEVRLDRGAVQATLEPRLRELAAATGGKVGPRRALRRVLGGAFRLFVSTAGGWLPVESYDVPSVTGLGGDRPLFRLRFELPASAPPLAPFRPGEGGKDEKKQDDGGPRLSTDPVVLASNPDPSLPTLKAYLRPEPVALARGKKPPRVDAPTLLDGVAISDLRIRTEVRGLVPAAVEHSGGPVGTGAPFPLFGGVPKVGSYVLLRHPELFRKSLEKVGVRIRWFGLPQDDEGFEGHYRDYLVAADGRRDGLFGNAVFRGRFRVEHPGTWRLGKNADPWVDVHLFRSEDDSGKSEPSPGEKVAAESRFEDLGVRAVPPPPHHDPAASALRLELTSPSYAFGNELYAQNVMHAVLNTQFDPDQALENCMSSCQTTGTIEGEALNDCVETCLTEALSWREKMRYPNEPYLPVAEAVSLDYSASGAGRFFHLLPFGGHAALAAPAAPSLVPFRGNVGLRLLPHFAYPGNLYLGFKGLEPPQVLTLFFRLDPGPRADRSVKLPPVAWQFLEGDRWRRLESTQVLADSTRGLGHTGIVALRLPSYEPGGGTVFTGDEQWLRASVPGEPGLFPRTLDVVPHAVTATWQVPLGEDGQEGASGVHLARPLPAHTITAAADELPGIATVDQPTASVGGRPPETRRTWEIRLGERLRHKDRAILEWDYERLVLEEFPRIWKVRALPVHDRRRGGAPGHVMVMVVPGPDSAQELDPTAPLASPELLDRIRGFLERRTSPFVRLHVVNPVYVRVEVDVTVRFADGVDPGASIERLDRELVRYLSPWFYDAERAGRRLAYAATAALSDFVLSREEVDVLVDLKLRSSPELEPLDTDWHFLTSAKKHRIRDAGAVRPEDRNGY